MDAHKGVKKGVLWGVGKRRVKGAHEEPRKCLGKSAHEGVEERSRLGAHMEMRECLEKGVCWGVVWG